MERVISEFSRGSFTDADMLSAERPTDAGGFRGNRNINRGNGNRADFGHSGDGAEYGEKPGVFVHGAIGGGDCGGRLRDGGKRGNFEFLPMSETPANLHQAIVVRELPRFCVVW